jgi:hypothetical protein
LKTLKELLDNAVETEKLATIDLETWPRNSLSSITNTVNEAKANLADLKKEYGSRISELTIGIFAMGSGAEAFAKMAEVEGGTLTVHADALYTRLADMITPVLADSREFSIIAFNRLIQGLTDVAHELGFKAMDMPKYVIGPVPTRESLVQHIRKTVRATYGDDMNRLYIAAEIQKLALAAKFKSTALPIVFIGMEDAAEIEGLKASVAKFGDSIFVSENAVDKAFVLKVFATVKAKFKKTAPETK